MRRRFTGLVGPKCVLQEQKEEWGSKTSVPLTCPFWLNKGGVFCRKQIPYFTMYIRLDTSLKATCFKQV